MSKLFKYVMILVCVNTFAQKTYEFDYMSVYEHLNNPADSVKSVSYIFANSKNTNQVVYVTEFQSDKTSAQLFDFEQHITYRYETKATSHIKNLLFNTLFENPIRHSLADLSIFKQEDKYNVIYQKEGDANKIIIETFKNKKKKKKVSEHHLIMKPYPFVKNQFYASYLKFAYKFDINSVNTDEVIIKSYTIDTKTNTIKHIRELKNIQPFDLQITISEDIHFKNNKTTP